MTADALAPGVASSAAIMMTSLNGNIFRVTGHFLREIHRSLTRSFAIFFDLRSEWTVELNREAGDLRRHRTHYDVIVMHGVEYAG